MKLALAALLFAVAAACATTSDECQRRIDACLARCEAADPDRSQAAANTANESYTECQRRCGCGNATTAPPPPQGKPTLTGNAPE